MPFSDPTQTIPYRHASWLPGSVWHFKATQDQFDFDKAAALVQTGTLKFDADAYKKAKRAGKKFILDIDTTTRMSGRMALLLTQSRGWEGPEFVLPETFPAIGPDGKKIYRLDPATGKEVPVPHELAGQLVPVTEEWVALLGPSVLEDIEDELNRLYAVFEEGDDAEQETFLPSGVGPSGPEAGEYE